MPFDDWDLEPQEGDPLPRVTIGVASPLFFVPSRQFLPERDDHAGYPSQSGEHRGMREPRRYGVELSQGPQPV